MFLRKVFHAAAVAAVMLLPGHSAAVSISVTGGSWELGSGWGAACMAANCDSNHEVLNVDWTISSDLQQTFTLETLNETFAVTFGTGVFRDENNTLELTETDHLDIAAILTLNSPQAGNVEQAGFASTSTGTLGDALADLALSFDPVTIDIGDGGQLAIELSDTSWTCNPSQACTFGNSQTRTISAVFTLTALPVIPRATSALAESPSLALMVLGLAVLGIVCRNRPQMTV